jgi:hypothetical protein
MACRSVSSFVSRDVDPRLSDAVILTALQASKGEPHPTPSPQLNFRRPGIEVIAFN